MAMKSTKLAFKKAYKSGDSTIDRVTQAIYNDLNDIIKAVNDPQGILAREAGGKGDIRVNDFGLQFHDGGTWQTVLEDTPTASHKLTNVRNDIEINEAAIEALVLEVAALDSLLATVALFPFFWKAN
jgi:hypothetical protein